MTTFNVHADRLQALSEERVEVVRQVLDNHERQRQALQAVAPLAALAEELSALCVRFDRLCADLAGVAAATQFVFSVEKATLDEEEAELRRLLGKD